MPGTTLIFASPSLLETKFCPLRGLVAGAKNQNSYAQPLLWNPEPGLRPVLEPTEPAKFALELVTGTSFMTVPSGPLLSGRGTAALALQNVAPRQHKLEAQTLTLSF
jgi:hypothetical protein